MNDTISTLKDAKAYSTHRRLKIKIKIKINKKHVTKSKPANSKPAME